MSLARRLELLRWAGRSSAWVLEGDYDSEYRYSGRPLEALQGLDTEGRVIYVGTFSKVLFPSLRLGYPVLPPDLVDAFTAARELSDWQPPGLDQVVLAHFMAEGHVARHVRRMRSLYAARQVLLAEEGGRRLSGLLDVPPAGAGMHLVGRQPKTIAKHPPAPPSWAWRRPPSRSTVSCPTAATASCSATRPQRGRDPARCAPSREVAGIGVRLRASGNVNTKSTAHKRTGGGIFVGTTAVRQKSWRPIPGPDA